MWLRTGFESGSDKKNHRTETTVDTEGRNRIGFKRELFVYRLAYNDDIVAFKNGPPARRSEPDWRLEGAYLNGYVTYPAVAGQPPAHFSTQPSGPCPVMRREGHDPSLI
jgi:hypothetical protein